MIKTFAAPVFAGLILVGTPVLSFGGSHPTSVVLTADEMKQWKATFKVDGKDMVDYFTAKTSGDAFDMCQKKYPKANSIDINPA